MPHSEPKGSVQTSQKTIQRELHKFYNKSCELVEGKFFIQDIYYTTNLNTFVGGGGFGVLVVHMQE